MSVAVVGLETTGVLPSTDWVIEVGVVLLDDHGSVEHEFATLVDPGIAGLRRRGQDQAPDQDKD